MNCCYYKVNQTFLIACLSSCFEISEFSFRFFIHYYSSLLNNIQFLVEVYLTVIYWNGSWITVTADKFCRYSFCSTSFINFISTDISSNILNAPVPVDETIHKWIVVYVLFNLLYEYLCKQSTDYPLLDLRLKYKSYCFKIILFQTERSKCMILWLRSWFSSNRFESNEWFPKETCLVHETIKRIGYFLACLIFSTSGYEFSMLHWDLRIHVFLKLLALSDNLIYVI